MEDAHKSFCDFIQKRAIWLNDDHDFTISQDDDLNMIMRDIVLIMKTCAPSKRPALERELSAIKTKRLDEKRLMECFSEQNTHERREHHFQAWLRQQKLKGSANGS